MQVEMLSPEVSNMRRYEVIMVIHEIISMTYPYGIAYCVI